MPHATPLIAMIVAGFVLAFILSALAIRLKVSPLVGYVLSRGADLAIMGEKEIGKRMMDQARAVK